MICPKCGKSMALTAMPMQYANQMVVGWKCNIVCGYWVERTDASGRPNVNVFAGDHKGGRRQAVVELLISDHHDKISVMVADGWGWERIAKALQGHASGKFHHDTLHNHWLKWVKRRKK